MLSLVGGIKQLMAVGSRNKYSCDRIYDLTLKIMECDTGTQADAIRK